jgi:hypothetical protein
MACDVRNDISGSSRVFKNAPTLSSERIVIANANTAKAMTL